MTDDLKAPERIWATEDAKNFGEDRFHTTRPMKGLTEYVPADRITTLEAALADMTRQRDAAMAGAVKVRELVWAETHDDRGDGSSEHNGGYEADSGFGVYEIGLGFGSDSYYWSVQDGSGNEIGSFDDPDAAKAAAQADYEARILSALTPDPDRMLALTAAAYEDAATTASEQERVWEAMRAIRARAHPNALSALSRIEAQAEARVLAVVRQAHETLIEINPNNYTHDEVVEANDAVVEAIFLLADLIGETHGKSPEWWEKRRAAIADATEAAAKGGV